MTSAASAGRDLGSREPAEHTQTDIASILDEIAAIAEDLGDRAVAQAVEAAGVHKGTSRLQLRVVGPAGSGRASLVNLLLGADVLPVTAIPKAPIGIDLRLGDVISVTRVDLNGDRVAVPPSQLRALLLGTDGSAAGRVEVETPHELLALCDLHVEPLERERSAASWRELLAASDYVIVLLNASALLSDLERRFVREHLVPQLGLERVAFIVNRIDLVPEEERDSILELFGTFLGPFQSYPAIIDLSLRESARTGEGREALTTLVGDLLARREPMRAEGLRQTVAVLIEELSGTATRMEALNALEAADVERVREQIAAQQPWLEHRAERTQRRIRAWVDTLLRETLQRRIEGFGLTLRNRLPEEIRSIDDSATVRRHLPGYIQAVWADYLRRQMAVVRTELAAEEMLLAEMIDADFRELLVTIGQPALEANWELLSDVDAFHVFVMPRRKKQRAESIARGLALNGLFMLVVSPPIGVLSLLASQVVQRAWHGDLAQAEREALTASAVAAARQVEGEIKRHMDEQFTALAGRMEQQVAGVYQRGMEGILALLDERTAHTEDLAARRKAIHGIAHERLPRLRDRLGPAQETVTP